MPASEIAKAQRMEAHTFHAPSISRSALRSLVALSATSHRASAQLKHFVVS
ncbi:hypothetical protein PC129_g22324 [Phytophthora cactorum]|uniref:Uncharacterized protein n=1 Tax=Phytophthora cactorum TaxID=29920 RepID=A0A8T0Y678_9STRA|nr:hypothetical protein Pcac1_g6185 [Phytophthora cactorum]KAG2796934.1 hypothetical protein PC112_g22001 [Phytophthora cactorum]KAG2798363.1 hypothetical protein PC111_g20884 [Phytophthora cactorum]KAG2825448.1 hypothetical protein PC113_g21908 [Phytophthora cactorum]KAG2878285.1 hypothetical protein PC114_g23193 [Phytophthora cactorum]